MTDIEKLIVIVRALKNDFYMLSTLLSESNNFDDLNDLISQNYPFNLSLDEMSIGVNLWLESIENEQITGGKKA